jgi:hypothetical protein
VALLPQRERQRIDRTARNIDAAARESAEVKRSLTFRTASFDRPPIAPFHALRGASIIGTLESTMKRPPQASPAPSATNTDDEHVELARLAAEVRSAWEQLGQACKSTDAALGTLDEAEAEAAQDIANDKLQAALDALCDTPARTVRGLQVKARATKIDTGEMFHDLRQSILDDLLALDGGAESSQKSHDDVSAPPSPRSIGGARSRRRPHPRAFIGWRMGERG